MISLALTCSSLSTAVADTPRESVDLSLKDKVGFVDQLVSVPFTPTKVFVIEEVGPGEVQRFPGYVVQAQGGAAQSAGNQEVLVGARVPLSNLGSDKQVFHFTFFLLDNVASFAATPVKRWSRKMLVDNSRPIDDLRVEVESVERKVQVQKMEHQAIDERLKALRDRASLIADIDKIVDLKVELGRLKSYVEDKSIEQQRLKKLIDDSRKNSEMGSDIDVLRRDLSSDLQEAAQVTAMADRLNSRRRDAAVASMQKKIALIKEMKAVDPEALAKEALKLRARRKELETRLNVGSPVATEDEAGF